MVMKRIAIYHLETLLWIARLGTFRAAADRLNTTQPAISARVREIEEQLGVTLFRREGRGMALTPRGRKLVRDCEPLWAGLEQALLGASDYAGAAGVVRIGSGEIGAASCLPGFVQTIERELPGVTLELEIDLTARMLQQLLSGTTDMVFLAGPIASPGLRTRAIGSVALVWAGGGAASGLDGPIWSLPSHSPLHGVMLEGLAQRGLARRTVHTCNNVRTLIEIVRGGAGIAVIPETMIRGDLASGALREVLPRPRRQIRFDVAIREAERDPLVLELWERAGRLDIDPRIASTAPSGAIDMDHGG